AFDAVIQRHDVLRASFPLVDSVPVQAIHDDVLVSLPQVEIPSASPELWKQGVANALTDLASQAFDLERGPVLHARIFLPSLPATAGCGMALGVVFHHAVADGGSLSIFRDDLVT